MSELPSQDLDHICRNTEHLWEEARGRRFFFTGGTGFFGVWLLESFLEANRRFSLDAQALVLTRDPGKFLARCPHLGGLSCLGFEKGDVRAFELPQGQFDYVVHAATEASAKQSKEEPLEMLSTILEGTSRTLAFAKNCGARKFLLASSGAVYGPQPPDISHLDEDFKGAPDCLDPASVYAEGKRAAELMCALYSDVFEVKIARCFAFVGPCLPLDAHFAIGNFIRDAMAGGPILVNGDGTPKRSYLYASDLAIWLWTILFAGASARPYNVGSGNAVSIQELAEVVRSVVRPSAEIKVSRERNPKEPIRQYVPSVRRVQGELGLQEHVLLVDAIERTSGWYLSRIEQRRGCRESTTKSLGKNPSF